MSGKGNSGKKNQKPKAKRSELLAKPKRPMSAYNFFFRSERAKILADAAKANEEGEGGSTTFEDIGRIIGKRWRSISDEELEKYKEMASEDSIRYREEMKTFYKDELTLMCLGHNTGVDAQDNQTNDSPLEPDDDSQHSDRLGFSERRASDVANEEEDKKPSAADAMLAKENKQLMEMYQKQQALMNSMPGQAAAAAGGSLSLPSLDPFQSQGQVATSPTPSASMNSTQLMNIIFQQQQQAPFAQAAMMNPQGVHNALLAQLMAQKALIEQQQQELERERRLSRMKDELLQLYMDNAAKGEEHLKLAAAAAKPPPAAANAPTPSNGQKMSAADMLSSEMLLRLLSQNQGTGGMETASAASASYAFASNDYQQRRHLVQHHQQQQQLHAAAAAPQPAQSLNSSGAGITSVGQYDQLLQLLSAPNRNSETSAEELALLKKLLAEQQSGNNSDQRK